MVRELARELAIRVRDEDPVLFGLMLSGLSTHDPRRLHGGCHWRNYLG